MICNNCKWKSQNVCKQCPYRSAFSAANLESVARHEPLAKGKNNEVHQLFSMQVHHRTNRLSDSDGRSIKAVLDGFVLAKVLPDDSPKFIPQIPKQTQELTKGQEETVIDIFKLF